MSEIQELVERLIRLEERVNGMVTNELTHLKQAIDRVETVVTRMANRGTRPPWSVVALITFLTATSVGLLVRIGTP